MAKKQNRLPVATKQAETQYTIPIIDKGEDMKSKVKYALEDIERAEMHRKDKELMKHVKKAAKDKMKCLGKI